MAARLLVDTAPAPAPLPLFTAQGLLLTVPLVDLAPAQLPLFITVPLAPPPLSVIRQLRRSRESVPPWPLLPWPVWIPVALPQIRFRQSAIRDSASKPVALLLLPPLPLLLPPLLLLMPPLPLLLHLRLLPLCLHVHWRLLLPRRLLSRRRIPLPPLLRNPLPRCRPFLPLPLPALRTPDPLPLMPWLLPLPFPAVHHMALPLRLPLPVSDRCLQPLPPLLPPVWVSRGGPPVVLLPGACPVLILPIVGILARPAPGTSFVARPKSVAAPSPHIRIGSIIPPPVPLGTAPPPPIGVALPLEPVPISTVLISAVLVSASAGGPLGSEALRPGALPHVPRDSRWCLVALMVWAPATVPGGLLLLLRLIRPAVSAPVPHVAPMLRRGLQAVAPLLPACPAPTLLPRPTLGVLGIHPQARAFFPPCPERRGVLVPPARLHRGAIPHVPPSPR